MKKIAFVLDGAMVGGIEIALINLMHLFDRQLYEIHLFTSKEENICLDRINDIHVHFISNSTPNQIFLANLKKFHFIKAARLLLKYFHLKLNKDKDLSFLRYFYSLNTLDDNYYDCVISYRHDTFTMATTLFQIRSSKKILFVHGKLLGDPSSEYGKWVSSFNKIYCVSEWTKSEVISALPETSEITEVFYNIIDSEDIINKSLQACELSNHITSILTVGRVSPEKGQDMIPRAAALLKEKGYSFVWYIIGDGQSRSEIEKKIEIFDVSDCVVLLGTQMNPFPYMKNCDIYVQTSYTEGWCLTVQEAKILCKPIVVTDLPVMREQIEHMENGVITDGICSESLYEGIRILLDSPELCEKFVSNLKKNEGIKHSDDLLKLYNYIQQ